MNWFHAVRDLSRPLLFWVLLCSAVYVCCLIARLMVLAVYDMRPKLLVIARRHGILRALFGGLIIAPIITLLYSFTFSILILAEFQFRPDTIGLACAVLFMITSVAVTLDILAFSINIRTTVWRPFSAHEIPATWREINATRAARIAIDLYWLQLLLYTTPVLIAGLPLTTATWIVTYQGDSPYLFQYFIYTVVLALMTLLILTKVRRFIWRLTPSASAVIAASWVVNHMNKRTGTHSIMATRSDPLDWYRQRLARTALGLDGMAARLDRALIGGASPVAVILRATAIQIRSYNKKSESVTSRLSDDMKSILSSTLMVCMGSARSFHYENLSKIVGAFNEDGTPAFSADKEKISFVSLLDRIGEGSEGIRKLLVILVIVLVLLSVMLGHVNLSKLTGVFAP
jgi:hypothetical protein